MAKEKTDKPKFPEGVENETQYGDQAQRIIAQGLKITDGAALTLLKEMNDSEKQEVFKAKEANDTKLALKELQARVRRRREAAVAAENDKKAKEKAPA